MNPIIPFIESLGRLQLFWVFFCSHNTMKRVNLAKIFIPLGPVKRDQNRKCSLVKLGT